VSVHVLVVCTANIARSPLAEAMLAASLESSGIEVASAGTQARPGHPAAENSQQLAVARGLDLEGHRSRPVSEDMIADAQLVLTMSERQRDRCAPLAAGAGAHVFTVREFARLLGAVDTAAAPASPAERLGWLVTQAHLARPSAPPAKGTEDVHDPIRDPWPAWVEMGAALDRTLSDVVEALGCTVGWQPPAPEEPVSGPASRRGARRRSWRRLGG
jgi:protein-tyrosine phosphatase